VGQKPQIKSLLAFSRGSGRREIPAIEETNSNSSYIMKPLSSK